MLAPTRHFGSSDAVGSWKTIWSWDRPACPRAAPFVPNGSPRKRIVPDVGGRRPTMARPSVVLPLPDSPTRPTVSAVASLRERPSTACTCPTVRRNTVPRVIGKCTRRSRTSSRSEEHTSELQSRRDLVCRLLLEKKKKKNTRHLLTQKKKPKN